MGKFALSDKYINEVIESRILAEFFYRAILPGFINVLNPTASGLFTVELMRRQLFTLSVKDNLGANVEEFTGMIAAYLKSLSNYTELHMVKGKDTIN